MGGEWDESKHPRVPAGSGDPSGQFASAAGGGELAGEAGTIRGMFFRIHKPDGGFTYQPRLHFEPKTGYAVSIFPARSFAKPVTQLSVMDITRYAMHNMDLLAKRGHFLGGWHDPRSHKAFLDVSVIVSSAAEAHRLCIKHDQKAYFDLSKGSSVTVNPHARSGGVAD